MELCIPSIFFPVHEFCLIVDRLYLKTHELRKPTRISRLHVAEIITILLMFQFSQTKNFKHFYKKLRNSNTKDFGPLPSYSQFVKLIEHVAVYITILLELYCMAASEHSDFYVDATKIPVCSNVRAYNHKVFAGVAEWGKTGAGWFFGLKLHLVINAVGEIAGFKLTEGNVDDRAVIEEITQGIRGNLYGDKGYIDADLSKSLFGRGLQLITFIKKGMKNVLVGLREKLMLKKRSVVESVFNVLKGSFNVSHTRHRSVENAKVHVLMTLLAYCMRVSKPEVMGIEFFNLG